MKRRIKTGLAISIWCGMVMFPASLLVFVIKGTKPTELYFTEDYLFYEIMLVLVGLFVIGFLVGGKDGNKKNSSHNR